MSAPMNRGGLIAALPVLALAAACGSSGLSTADKAACRQTAFETPADVTGMLYAFHDRRLGDVAKFARLTASQVLQDASGAGGDVATQAHALAADLRHIAVKADAGTVTKDDLGGIVADMPACGAIPARYFS